MLSRVDPRAECLAIRTRLTSVIAMRQRLILVTPDNALVSPRHPAVIFPRELEARGSARARKVGTSLINRKEKPVEIKIVEKGRSQ